LLHRETIKLAAALVQTYVLSHHPSFPAAENKEK
jgi:hypothetical protein